MRHRSVLILVFTMASSMQAHHCKQIPIQITLSIFYNMFGLHVESYASERGQGVHLRELCI